MHSSIGSNSHIKWHQTVSKTQLLFYLFARVHQNSCSYIISIIVFPVNLLKSRSLRGQLDKENALLPAMKGHRFLCSYCSLLQGAMHPCVASHFLMQRATCSCALICFLAQGVAYPCMCILLLEAAATHCYLSLLPSGNQSLDLPADA